MSPLVGACIKAPPTGVTSMAFAANQWVDMSKDEIALVRSVGLTAHVRQTPSRYMYLFDGHSIGGFHESDMTPADTARVYVSDEITRSSL